METDCPKRLSRRHFLSSVAFLALAGSAGSALSRSYQGGALPWSAYSADPPVQVKPDGWYYFTPDEAATIEAMVDRIVPADELSLGGRDAGCAVYIDRQLAGPYGKSSRLYTKGPFLTGLPTQGYQGEARPAAIYRSGLAAVSVHLKQTAGGRTFAALSAAEQDEFLRALEAGKVELPAKVNGKALFALILSNTMEGFFADPVYGGNKDMTSWRMLGFPGARYDYRDHVSKHNQPYPLPPVSIAGAPEWLAK